MLLALQQAHGTREQIGSTKSSTGIHAGAGMTDKNGIAEIAVACASPICQVFEQLSMCQQNLFNTSECSDNNRLGHALV
eukprot:SAG11_NODE_86_length_17300_cov_11.466717_25_plen_79_part_00